MACKVVNKSETPIMLSEQIFFLNKSKLKYVSVGFKTDIVFSPTIRFAGTRSYHVVDMCREDFVAFLKLEQWITDICKNWSAVTQNDNRSEMKQCGSITVMFYDVKSKPVLQIFKSQEDVIYLGQESLNSLFYQAHVILTKVHLLEEYNFSTFYKTMLRRACKMEGNVLENMKQLLKVMKQDENVATVKQLMLLEPDVVVKDMETCKIFF